MIKAWINPRERIYIIDRHIMFWTQQNEDEYLQFSQGKEDLATGLRRAADTGRIGLDYMYMRICWNVPTARYERGYGNIYHPTFSMIAGFYPYVCRRVHKIRRAIITVQRRVRRRQWMMARKKELAVAMSMHHRLGEGVALHALDSDLLRLICSFVTSSSNPHPLRHDVMTSWWWRQWGK